MIEIAERVKYMSESETLAMARMSRELRAKGHDVISLSLGEPDFDTPDFIKQAAHEAIDQNYSHYTPVAGYDELLEAICEKFTRDNDLHYQKNQVVVSTGAKQCIANTMLALVNPGDEVLMPAPYWVSYREIIRLAGGIPVEIFAPIEADFKITPEQLQMAITHKAKVLIFSSPSNPTGSLYTRNELIALSEVIKNAPWLTVISDEIYELINYDGQHTSIGSIQGMQDQVVTINGLSKGFAMTGWRLGYMGAPTAIAQACIKIQGQVTSATCSITQRAAIAALKANPQQMMYMKDEFERRRNIAYKLLSEMDGLKLNKPSGAYYFFVDISHYLGKKVGSTVLHSADDFCQYLLHDAYVATVPGSAFGASNYVRISFSTTESLIREAIERIKKSLSKIS